MTQAQSSTGEQAGETLPAGANLNTDDLGSQTGNANIADAGATLENANTGSAPAGEGIAQPTTPAWQGDARYFQTGDKAGTLKPRFRQVGGIGKKPREIAGLDAEKDGKKLAGLNIEALTATASGAGKPQKSATVTAEEKKALKEEKKKLSADFTSRVVMRLLDAVVNIISKGQYGEDFTPEQMKKRMTYREMLQDEWKAYIMTLDVDLAPWAMVAVGSLEYVGEAFNTPAGKERVKTMREKVLGGIFNATIGRMFK